MSHFILLQDRILKYQARGYLTVGRVPPRVFSPNVPPDRWPIVYVEKEEEEEEKIKKNEKRLLEMLTPPHDMKRSKSKHEVGADGFELIG